MITSNTPLPPDPTTEKEKLEYIITRLKVYRFYLRSFAEKQREIALQLDDKALEIGYMLEKIAPKEKNDKR